MLKQMRTELVIFALSSIGFMFESVGIQSGAVIINTTLGVAFTLYLILGFYLFSNEKIEKKYVGMSIFSGILLGVSILLILFVHQEWLGSDSKMVSYFAVGFSLLIAFISRGKLGRNPDELYYKKMLLRSGIILIVSLYCATLKTQKNYGGYYDVNYGNRYQNSRKSDYYRNEAVEELAVEDYEY